MYLISHRGNVSGKLPELENTPAYILSAIEQGYMVEIDVWCDSDGLFLGHDGAALRTTPQFLKNPQLIIHAKNSAAIEPLQYYNTHWFWHNTDDYTITSKGWVWAYPGKVKAGNNCIAVLPEIHNVDTKLFAGVCSDVIGLYKQ